MASPKIILYTYHGCPWAHRAHIALKETGLDYEEVIIDIKKPREPWYLEINPVWHAQRQGLVLRTENLIRYTPTARPRPQPFLQRPHHHRIRHRLAVHRRRPPLPPPPAVRPSRQCPVPGARELLRRHFLQQGDAVVQCWGSGCVGGRARGRGGGGG